MYVNYCIALISCIKVYSSHYIRQIKTPKTPTWPVFYGCLSEVTWNQTPSFSDLKPNYSKCEVAGIGVLKGAFWALCGLKLIDLTNNTIKILGLHFSYNEVLRNEKNFSDTIIKIENVLRVWRQRDLTLEGKITIIKTLAISKIVYNAYLSTVTNLVIEALKKYRAIFSGTVCARKLNTTHSAILMKKAAYKV